MLVTSKAVRRLIAKETIRERYGDIGKTTCTV